MALSESVKMWRKASITYEESGRIKSNAWDGRFAWVHVLVDSGGRTVKRYRPV